MNNLESIIYLKDIIEKFVSNKISAIEFEKSFSSVFDFEDNEYPENLSKYFVSVREVLEHYSFSDLDIENYPEYYINGKQLKEKILKLKGDLSLTLS